MKAILVPTDFSDASMNAIEYAAEMALSIKAKLILFNVYTTPPIAIEVPVLVLTDDELRAKCMDRLNEVKINLHKKRGPNLDIECDCALGFEIDMINEFAAEKKPSMIVMGMQGANYIVERFLGSTTTAIIRKSQYPVLCINKDISFRTIKKILLAVDGKQTEYKKVLDPLKKLVHLFNAHLYILHVAPALAIVPEIEKTSFNAMEDEMTDIQHSYHYHTSNDVVGDINAFAIEINADMVVMIPRKHSLLDGILIEAYTKKMAFHTKFPLLSLHA